MLFAKFKIFKAYFEMYYIYDSSISTGVADIGTGGTVGVPSREGIGSSRSSSSWVSSPFANILIVDADDGSLVILIITHQLA